VKGQLTTVRGIALTDNDRLRRKIIEGPTSNFSVDLGQIASGETKPIFTTELVAIDEMASGALMRRNGLSIEIPEGSPSGS